MFKNIDLSTPYKRNWLMQSGNLFLADILGTAVEGAAVTNMHRFERAFPNFSKAAVDTLTVPITYAQQPIEWALSHTKTFEGQEYYDKRLQKTPEDRAKGIANAGFRYGSAVGIGWLTTIGAERALCTINHAEHIPAKFWIQDMGIHLGLVALMGSPLMAPTTGKIKEAVKVVSKACGANEEQAEDISRLTVASAIPNYSTFAIVSARMLRYNKMKALAGELDISPHALH